ncbi:TPA: conjugal transfer protein TraE, partial [Klebsiella pneumoniae subsp. pneumoniae]|nr:conjugal transfer protein TraE [Klebsiella pneumoniae subsp. pneumoniae]
EEVSVAGSKASESYKTQWGLFIATTLGNINPKNVTFVTSYILKMFPASKQSELEAELKKASDLMLARKVDQTFVAEDVNFLPSDNVLYVWGTRKTKFLNVSDKEQTERWTYEMVLSVKSGRPRILYLNQYSGTPNIKKVTVNGKVLEKEFTENTDMNKQLNEAEAQ